MTWARWPNEQHVDIAPKHYSRYTEANLVETKPPSDIGKNYFFVGKPLEIKKYFFMLNCDVSSAHSINGAIDGAIDETKAALIVFSL